MILYVFLFITIAILALLVDGLIYKQDKGILSLISILGLAIIFSFITAIRDGVGTDFENYVEIYNKIFPLNRVFELEIFIEPGFLLIGSLFKTINAPVSLFFFFISFLSILVLNKSIRNFQIPNPVFSILVYYCYFFFSFHFNIIRHGIMVSFIWLAFSYISQKKPLHYFLFITIASLFHFSAIFFVPFYWLLRIKLSSISLLIIFTVTLISGVLPIFQIILSIVPASSFLGKIINYYLFDYYANIDSSYGITLGTILNISILIFIVIKRKTFCEKLINGNIYINSLLFAIVLLIALNEFSVFAERLVNVLYVSLIFIIPSITFVFFKKNYSRILVTFSILVLLIAVLSRNINTIESNGGYQYLPYKTILKKTF